MRGRRGGGRARCGRAVGEPRGAELAHRGSARPRGARSEEAPKRRGTRWAGGRAAHLAGEADGCPEPEGGSPRVPSRPAPRWLRRRLGHVRGRGALTPY